MLIIATKDYFAVIFTDSKVMQVAVSKLAFLLGITMILNSVQPVISGEYSLYSYAYIQNVVWLNEQTCDEHANSFSFFVQALLLEEAGKLLWLT